MLCESCIDWTVIRGNFVGVILSLVTSLLVVLFRQQIPSQMGGLALSIIIQVNQRGKGKWVESMITQVK